ncbi:RHS repeat-associated core domain-containing protein [Sphingobacterium thalpophilum]|uniref:RHS repeat-associated core domain-containing protein n=1 Tax=Sphingobacterium thalpophilum TaxID=259 RepID=UPI0009DDA25D
MDSRYGYQELYAEKDKETGWNSFELRNYDPAVGRWLTVDPMGQYVSPYVGMGNNPVSLFDPTGGWSGGDPEKPVLVICLTTYHK